MISKDEKEELFASCSINLTKKGVKCIKLGGKELTRLESWYKSRNPYDFKYPKI
jgi:IS5 family transposase